MSRSGGAGATGEWRDHSFSADDVIRIYNHHLLEYEKKIVRDYFGKIVEKKEISSDFGDIFIDTLTLLEQIVLFILDLADGIPDPVSILRLHTALENLIDDWKRFEV